jgi:trans-aconitate methyltransferase
MGEDYHSHSRPEVRALVPRAARIVVDVGCGAGAVGAALKRDDPGIQVRGLELDPRAVAQARACLDDVEMASAEGGLPPSWPAPDCVIFADVLEHLVDPWTTLRRWRASLRPGTTVVVSLPNVGHHTVAVPLWKGRWDYEDEGLLDRTHLRFFTRETALELIRSSGLNVDVIQRAILLPGGFLGQQVLRRLVAWGLERERDGSPLPEWQTRMLDLCSRQFLFLTRVGEPVAAAVTEGRE